METLLQDLKYGIRSLAKAPGFTLVAVIALAIGIGANTAIFSVVDGTLFRPLPYSSPDRLVSIVTIDPASGESNKFVIGMQRPSPRSFWKIHYLNRGIAPVEAEDPEVAPLIQRCVKEKMTLTATYTYDVLALADVVVVILYGVS